MTEISNEDAIKFLEGACRNWSRVPPLSKDDVGDVAAELYRFVASRRASPSGVEAKGLVDYLWQELCELPDRTSPDEYPDMAMATLPEITAIVETFFERQALTPPHSITPDEGGEPVAWASCTGCNGTGDQGGNPSYGACDDCGGSGRIGTLSLPADTASQARVKVLEEALKSLLDINDNSGPFGGELHRDRVNRAWEVARTALQQAKEKGNG